ncbi:40S ribosomal protein S4, X isoform, partial [Mortierella sp. GBA35]
MVIADGTGNQTVSQPIRAQGSLLSATAMDASKTSDNSTYIHRSTDSARRAPLIDISLSGPSPTHHAVPRKKTKKYQHVVIVIRLGSTQQEDIQAEAIIWGSTESTKRTKDERAISDQPNNGDDPTPTSVLPHSGAQTLMRLLLKEQSVSTAFKDLDWARGPKKHLKRLNAPKHWMLDKLTGTYAPRPTAGPHKLRECLPLVILMRNRLKYALNGKEVQSILMQRLVK